MLARLVSTECPKWRGKCRLSEPTAQANEPPDAADNPGDPRQIKGARERQASKDGRADSHQAHEDADVGCELAPELCPQERRAGFLFVAAHAGIVAGTKREREYESRVHPARVRPLELSREADVSLLPASVPSVDRARELRMRRERGARFAVSHEFRGER